MWCKYSDQECVTFPCTEVAIIFRLFCHILCEHTTKDVLVYTYDSIIIKFIAFIHHLYYVYTRDRSPFKAVGSFILLLSSSSSSSNENRSVCRISLLGRDFLKNTTSTMTLPLCMMGPPTLHIISPSPLMKASPTPLLIYLVGFC